MKPCSNCQQSFTVTDADRAFYSKLSPSFSGKKVPIPPPTLCPDCRMQRRLSWRNERALYWRNCEATGKRILSVFVPHGPYTVYDNDYWHGDQWNALDYGREFDFSRSFFEQFDELLKVVPQLARSAVGNQNCEYVNQCGWCKNCYLIFEAEENEDCYHCGYLYDSKTCLDDLMCYQSELCFDCINIQNCYGLSSCQNCDNCSDSSFLKNCIGCKRCFGCVNMTNKEYCFFNEQLSKEEYEKKLIDVDLSDYTQYQQWKQKAQEFALQFPHKYMTGVNNEDSTGDYLRNTQRCHHCFDVHNSQDCAYVSYARNVNNVHDMTTFGAKEGASFCYEVHEIGDGVRNLLFCDQVWDNAENLMYSKLCGRGCHDLFACVSMKRHQYCILNKQYSQEEYEELVPRIIDHMRETGEWGEFFPVRISPFAYNETIAIQFFPMTKEKVLERGWKWSDYEEAPPEVEKVIPADRLPNKTSDVPDDILNWAIQCEVSNKLFRLVPQELRYYRQQGLPIPRRHPNQRHEDRLALRNPWKLWDRTCDQCQTSIQTSYDPLRPEKVYCETCFQQSLI